MEVLVWLIIALFFFAIGFLARAVFRRIRKEFWREVTPGEQEVFDTLFPGINPNHGKDKR